MQPESVVGESVIQELCEIAASCPEGCFVEFGVYKGGTAYRLSEVARRQGRKLYLYDTFTGIPLKDDVDVHVIGDFSETSVDAVRDAIPDAIICQGVFPETLIKMPPVAFVHVDADQYRSVKAACEVFPPLMVKGGVMVFDDYGCLSGATKAVEEFFPNVGLTRQNKGMVVI